MDTADGALLDAALRYAAAGFPVIPLYSASDGHCDCYLGERCESPAKHPRTQHGLTDATTNTADIRRWWGMWGHANIGLTIPSGYVVVDIDGDEGKASLEQDGCIFPPTSVAQTGRGWHYFYRTPVTIPPKVGFLPHVDLRGPGSYVVAAPSIHVTGRTYAWRKPLENMGDAPAWLTSRGPLAHEKLAPADWLEGVAKGQRDTELFSFAARCRYFGFPYEDAERWVLEKAAKCAPPFPENDARLKVQAAYGRYPASVSLERGSYEVVIAGKDAVTVSTSSPKGPVRIEFTELELGSRALDATMQVTLLLPGTNPEPYIQRLNLLSPSSREACRRELDAVFGKDVGWTSILALSATKAYNTFVSIDRSVRWGDLEGGDEMGFVVDVMVPSEGTTILFGSGSSGKTMLTLHMAICVALGLPWLGRATEQRNVLWIDYESGTETLRRRSARLCRAMGLDPAVVADSLRYWNAEGSPFADTLPGLQRVIAAQDIRLLVLDHAAAACGGEPEKSDSALRFYRSVSKLGLPMIALAHITGEMERDPSQVLRPFGSIFWHNGARRTWFVQKYQEQESSVSAVGLFNRKVNDGMKPGDLGVTVFYNDPGGPIQIVSSDLRLTPELQAVQGCEYVIAQALTRPMTYAEIAEVTGLRVSTVKASIRRHPRMFRQADDGETDTRGGRGNVVRWVVQSEWRETDTDTDAISKLPASVSVGEGYSPPPETDTQKPIQTDTADAVYRFTGNGWDEAANPARCGVCAAPLFGDQCVICVGFN